MRALRVGMLAIVCGVLLFGIVGPWLPVGSPTSPVGLPFAAPNAEHPLGTDFLGRDALARVAYGGRTLLLQVFGATLLGSVVGLAVGTLTGLAANPLARVPLRVVDGITALPSLLVLLLLAAGLPGNDVAVLIAIAGVSVPFSVRVIRAATERVAALPFVSIARARGDGQWHLIRHDVLPNIVETAATEAGLRFIAATQLAATAGFLGLGSSAPAANWGRLVRENIDGVALNPWPLLVPAALTVALALGLTLVIDRFAVGTEAADRTRVGHDQD